MKPIHLILFLAAPWVLCSCPGPTPKPGPKPAPKPVVKELVYEAYYVSAENIQNTFGASRGITVEAAPEVALKLHFMSGTVSSANTHNKQQVKAISQALSTLKSQRFAFVLPAGSTKAQATSLLGYLTTHGVSLDRFEIVGHSEIAVPATGLDMLEAPVDIKLRQL